MSAGEKSSEACLDGKLDEVDEGIVKKMERYFYEDDEFAEIFEEFANKNASKIDLDTDECKLEYTELYDEFHALYEGALSEYIEKQGSTTKQFYSEVRVAFEKDDKSDVAVFAQIMMATCDFDVFLMLMRETARRQRGQKMIGMSSDDFFADEVDQGGSKK